MFDGTTVTMPDTWENQEVYPQNVAQEKGLGFPIARVGAVISLSCGAVMNLGIYRYAGKGQGEVSLLRQLWDVLSPGDVLLGDRLVSNWAGIVMLRKRGFKLVSRFNKPYRKADFRRGTHLGKEDHIVRWHKPTSIRSVDRKTYTQLPEYVTVRKTRIHVSQPGFRSKNIVVVTTFLNPEEMTKKDLAFLYCARWNNELDLRSIKITLQMDQMRCKTPELIRQKTWAHIRAYNLIRTIIAQAENRAPSRAENDQFQRGGANLESLSQWTALHHATICIKRS